MGKVLLQHLNHTDSNSCVGQCKQGDGKGVDESADPDVAGALVKESGHYSRNGQDKQQTPGQHTSQGRGLLRRPRCGQEHFYPGNVVAEIVEKVQNQHAAHIGQGAQRVVEPLSFSGQAGGDIQRQAVDKIEEGKEGQIF